MRQELHIEAHSNESTPLEAWTTTRTNNHWYDLQADFALEGLGEPTGSCLVIGSPIFEAQDLETEGWEVTYVDVREPEVKVGNFILGDATQLRLPENSFDSASSTCVLCHAGLGRYGDPIVEDGDVKILDLIYRSLKPGGKSAITFGPVCGLEIMVRQGSCQRIYGRQSARNMVLMAGFRILKERILDIVENEWLDDFKVKTTLDRHCLSMILKKD